MKQETRNRLALAHSALKNGYEVEVLFGGHRLQVRSLLFTDDMIRFGLQDGSLMMLDPDAQFAIIQSATPKV